MSALGSVIGGFWLLAEIWAGLIIFVGAATNPWLHWMEHPAWWVCLIAADLVIIGHLVAAGRWRVAAVLLLLVGLGAWCLHRAIAPRRLEAARHVGRWDPDLWRTVADLPLQRRRWWRR